MIMRNLDKNGDWLFGQGKSNFISGNDAIGLNIRTRVFEWVNDCFFNMTAGVDWLNGLGSRGQQKIIEQQIRKVILNSYGVTALTDFSMSLIGRAINVSYSINTIFSNGYQNTLNKNLQNAG